MWKMLWKMRKMWKMWKMWKILKQMRMMMWRVEPMLAEASDRASGCIRG